MKQIGIQELQYELAEAIIESQQSPITITDHGKPNAILLGYDLYHKLLSPKTGLDLFVDFDWSNVDLESHPKFRQREIVID